MGKKYEKVGQADIYREKKSGCGAIIGWIIFIVIILFIIGSCSGS